MAKETPRQKRIVGRVMHEFKEGELTSSGGRRVRNPKQAIAIALHEAGASRDQTGEKRAPGQEPTRAELYRRAAEKNVKGRSRMTKAELAEAVG